MSDEKMHNEVSRQTLRVLISEHRDEPSLCAYYEAVLNAYLIIQFYKNIIICFTISLSIMRKSHDAELNNNQIRHTQLRSYLYSVTKGLSRSVCMRKENILEEKKTKTTYDLVVTYPGITQIEII